MLQFMVNGAVGHHGKAVLFHVTLESRRDIELAPIQHHLFMATTVLAMLWNSMFVINQFAAV